MTDNPLAHICSGWCNHPDVPTVVVTLAYLDTLRADLTIADTTAANLHDEIRKRDEAIATLRAALRELRGKVEGLACDCENHADCQMECHVWNDDRVVSLAAVLDLIDRELEP